MTEKVTLKNGVEVSLNAVKEFCNLAQQDISGNALKELYVSSAKRLTSGERGKALAEQADSQFRKMIESSDNDIVFTAYSAFWPC